MTATRILLAERLLLIAVAGGIGAVLRYVLSRWVMTFSGPAFPAGTLVVNVLGCALFGLAWGIADYRGVMPERMRVVILIGFLGAFTTFSSFAHETLVLAKDRHVASALLNVVLNNALGLAAAAAGYQASRWL